MKKTIAIVSALIVAGFYFWPKAEEAVQADKSANQTDLRRALVAKTENRAKEAGRSPAMEEGGLAGIPLADDEKRSISTLMDMLSNPDQVGKNPRALFDALGRAGLKPVAAKDANEFTGTMWTVRTDNALPGTRYFHAQLFGEDSTHMQHISFEIRPGKDSMSTALEIVRQANPGLGDPEIENADFVLWKKSDGRVISVKKLNAEEMRGNRFNAHSPDDVGTIWVSSEDEPEHETSAQL